MRKIKKTLSLALALAIVLTMTTATMYSSALGGIELGDGKIGLGIAQGIFDSMFGKTNPPADETETPDATTEKEPLIEFYIDYEVVRKFHFDFSIGKTTTTTTEATTEPVEVTEPETPLAPQPETTQLIVVPETEAPKADIPDTGDAGIAAIAALSAVSAAAFVIAKKK